MTDQITTLLDTARIAVAHYAHQPHLAIPHLYRLCDAALAQWHDHHPVACCSNCDATCCKQGRVAVSPAEALYIVKNNKLNKPHIKQSVIDNIQACPLLTTDNRCSIYKDRPLQCRGYLVPDGTRCNESYGATSMLAAQLQELTINFVKLNLANALLIAMQSRTYAKYLAGDNTIWAQATMESQ